MAKFISVWMTLLIISLTIYTPIFFVMNSSDDEIEELTFEQIIPSLSMRGITKDEIEKKVAILHSMDVSTDVGILDALKDIEGVKDIETSVSSVKEGKVEQNDMVDSVLNRVVITFSDKNNVSYEISAIVIEKSFMNFRPTTLMAVDSIKNNISREYGHEDMFEFFGNLFKNESASIYVPL